MAQKRKTYGCEKHTCSGQEVPAVQTSEVVRVSEDVGPTRYCSIAFSPPQVSAGGLHGGEARGTSCIHTDTWSRKTKKVTDVPSVRREADESRLVDTNLIRPGTKARFPPGMKYVSTSWPLFTSRQSCTCQIVCNFKVLSRNGFWRPRERSLGNIFVHTITGCAEKHTNTVLLCTRSPIADHPGHLHCFVRGCYSESLRRICVLCLPG